MSSARHDYQQFLEWVHDAQRGASEDTRRMANLIESNFDRVAAISRAQGRRSVVLAALAREALPGMGFEPPVVTGNVLANARTWTTLHSLTIGPFRGFRVQETFNFPQRITMFYGPNGSGKTSLCEALELALLGSVDEASAKRIPPQRYFANSYEGRFEAPVLAAVDAQGQTSLVTANSDAYRFCFIEKNRIDNFSRIAAKTTGEKKDLIASLFGLEQFHDFVANFNELLDAQLGLATPREQELATRRAALQRDQATVDNEIQAVEAIVCDEEAYAKAFASDLSYSQLLALIGSDETPGRLHQLTAQLDSTAPGLYGISSEKLVAAYHAADAAQTRLEEVNTKLSAKTAEASFQSLYNAVLGLQDKMSDNCPACNTPLTGDYRAARNPYAQAQEGLAQLKDLAALQAELAVIRREWEFASRSLESLLSHFAQRVGADAGSQDERLRYLSAPEVDFSKAWWRAGYEQLEGAKSMAKKIVDLAAECERIDAETNVALASRAQMAQERARLVQAAQAVAGFVARRAELNRQIATAKQAIANFDQMNAVNRLRSYRQS